MKKKLEGSRKKIKPKDSKKKKKKTKKGKNGIGLRSFISSQKEISPSEMKFYE